MTQELMLYRQFKFIYIFNENRELGYEYYGKRFWMGIGAGRRCICGRVLGASAPVGIQGRSIRIFYKLSL